MFITDISASSDQNLTYLYSFESSHRALSNEYLIILLVLILTELFPLEYLIILLINLQSSIQNSKIKYSFESPD